MKTKYVEETIEEIRLKTKIVPSGEPVHAWTQTPVGIDDVIEAVADLGESRDWIIKTILAVYVSTFLEKKNPIWLMVVGNPSSNKTTLVDLLKDNEHVYRLDTMTGNPFSSGQQEKEKPQDLLPILDGKCFVIKEYGTLFGKSDEMVKSLIGDLTAIYDGEYSKHSPTRGTVRYESYFSHIGCVTPFALESRKRYMSQVGARFVFLRIPSLTDEEKTKSLKEMWNVKTTKKSNSEVREVMNRYLERVANEVDEDVEVVFPEKVKDSLTNWAMLIGRARGIVITEKNSFQTDDGLSKTHYEVVDKQVEEPFRAFLQIKKIAICLALVSFRREVNEDDLEIIRKIVLSSMTGRRADTLKVFSYGNTFTARSASEILSKHQKTIKRNLDELVSLDVLDSKKGENQSAREYSLKPQFRDVFPRNDELVDEDFLKDLFKD